MKKPRLLDLFCCAGGAGMGYARAGFEVVGVDIIPQPHYPFEFHQGDALEFLREHGHMFDAIHASPPCQAYSETRKIQSNDHPELIPPTRMALQQIGPPWGLAWNEVLGFTGAEAKEQDDGRESGNREC